MIDAAATSMRAAERQPWPKVELVAADGSTVASDRVARAGTWIVVYVSADCAACDPVLTSVTRLGEAAARTVVVVAGDAQALSKVTAAYTTLADVTWLADPSQALAVPLRAQSVPIIVGMRDRTIEWTIAGVLANQAEIGTVLASWLAR